MGLQNSTARRLSIPDLTTTVLTLTLTGLAADTQFPGPTWVLVRRRLIVVATMLLGALLGALLLHWSVAAPLVIGAALVAMLTLSYLFVWLTVEQRTAKRGASSAEEDGRNASRDGMA